MTIEIYALKSYVPHLKGLIRDIRAVWLCEELALPYKRISLDSEKKEHKQEKYLALNPFGKVPTMKDGDFVLFESAAICTYLSDKAGKLIPKAGTKERNIYDQWLFALLNTIEPNLARIYAADFMLEKGEKANFVREIAAKNLKDLLPVIDKQVSKSGFYLGNEFSVADIHLTCSLNFIQHSEVLKEYPNLQKYFKAMTERSGFKTAFQVNGT